MKQTVKLGIIVLVVAALATAGIALAQSDEAETLPTPAERIAGHLSPLVDDGTITGDQALAVGEYLAEHAPRRHGDQHRPRVAVIAFDVVADTIGIDMEALREALGEGQTIAEVAEANGVSGQTVIDALVAALDARLDGAVENGRITEEQKAEHLIAATEKITTAVNDGLPERPDRGHRRGRGHHGPRGGGLGGFPGGPGPGPSTGTSA